MATHLKVGLNTTFDNDDCFEVYVDADIVQISDPLTEKLLGQFTYEELRGIMAIMAAEQEKQHLYIRAQSKNN